MFSREFMQYLNAKEKRSDVKNTQKEPTNASKSMFYIILKCSAEPKKA